MQAAQALDELLLHLAELQLDEAPSSSTSGSASGSPDGASSSCLLRQAVKACRALQQQLAGAAGDGALAAGSSSGGALLKHVITVRAA